MAERSKAKRAKLSFASKNIKFLFLTRSFASRFWLRCALPFLKWTNNWSLYPLGLKNTFFIPGSFSTISSVALLSFSYAVLPRSTV